MTRSVVLVFDLRYFKQKYNVRAISLTFTFTKIIVKYLSYFHIIDPHETIFSKIRIKHIFILKVFDRTIATHRRENGDSG